MAFSTVGVSPYCGNQNQNTLAYFTDDDGLYRLYVCEQCRRYLKTIDLRQANGEIGIPLERLFTLSIDMEAREYGYGDGNPGAKIKGGKDEFKHVNGIEVD